MISISRILCDTASPGDSLRYPEHRAPAGGPLAKPVIVWNCTRRCNLICAHCYASAALASSDGEMTTAQGLRMISDLARFGVPVMLFSGGEPLLREDLLTLAKSAGQQGIRVALSTNGTLINEKVATELKETGFAEVGISLDGTRATNDRLRGRSGAFEDALRGIRNCVALGIRVSLRLTITRFNHEEIPAVFDLVEREGISRVCFYHLAYSGRGDSFRNNDVTHGQTREAVDYICARTEEMHARGLDTEVLTVGNHADGVYLYLQLRKRNLGLSDRARRLLLANGGNNSGVRIGAIDECGNVHPDQFWRHYGLGNVNVKGFESIWSDPAEPLLNKLRGRKQLLHGKCGRCRHLDLCNGNLRTRAEAVYDDLWAEDPACYLTETEITS